MTGEVDGVVFAGGASRRMGADKATLEIDGIPMVAHVVEVLSDLRSVTIVGGDISLSIAPTARRFGDLYPGQGPLGALISGFHATTAPVVLAVACDLPDLSSTFVRQIIQARRADDSDVAIPLVSGSLQWDVGVWHRRTLDHLETSFHAGERSLFRTARRLSITALVPTRPRELIDLDNPDDLRARQPG